MMNTSRGLITPNERDLRTEVREVQAHDPSLSQAEISRQSGIGPARLNQYLKGTYSGDNEAVAWELARWLDGYHAQRDEAAALPTGPDYVPTPSSERVITALRYAQLAGDIAVVYGGAGLGKTRAALHYRRETPNVWLATMTPATASTVPALEEIAEAVGIDASGGAARLQRAVVSRLRGTMGLLIIDEAQHLCVQALDEVRALHDASGLGIALLGNESVYARLTGGQRAAYLDRLYSRVGKRVRLSRLVPTTERSAGDVDTLLRAWDVSAADARQVLRKIADKPGALRTVTKVLRLAVLTAAGRGEAVTCADIRDAWHELSARDAS